MHDAELGKQIVATENFDPGKRGDAEVNGNALVAGHVGMDWLLKGNFIF